MFMKVIKRNQIIIFVGALMLIVAGYLNFSDNGLPINNLVPTSTLADAEEMASIGDAKLVSANVVDGEQENEIQDIVNNNDLNDSVIETNTEADIKNNDKNVSENITESSTTETSSNNIESVNKDKQLNNNYFTQSRLDRDTMYSQMIETYEKVYHLYVDHKDEWIKKAIVNTAKSGYFSSDRTIEQYNEKIWNLKPVK